MEPDNATSAPAEAAPAAGEPPPVEPPAAEPPTAEPEPPVAGAGASPAPPEEAEETTGQGGEGDESERPAPAGGDGDAGRSQAKKGGTPAEKDESRRVVYNTFLGQVDQRGSTLGFGEVLAAGETVPLSGVISETVIQDARGGYVSPGEPFDEAYLCLKRDHGVVLAGAPGIGKRTGTLVLLDTVLEKEGRIVALPPSITLRELARRDYEAGYGYVVLDRIAEQGIRAGMGLASPSIHDRSPTDTDHIWLSITEKLRDAGAYLVVTTMDMPHRASDSVAYVRWERPSMTDTLRAYLDGAVDENTVVAVAELAPEELAMSDLVRIADRIAAGKTPEAAVNDVLDEASRRKVREWFEGEPTRSQVLEVTVLAFVAGIVERDFEACLHSLEKALEETWPTPKPDAADPLSRAGEQPGAERTAGGGPASADAVEPGDLPMPQHRALRVREDGLIRLIRLRDGASARRILAFREDGYRRYVLEQLADLYSNEFWDAVRHWLNWLITYEQFQINIGAGLALLSYTTYEEIEFSYLEPWSSGDAGWQGRHTAVYVLWFMCLDEALVPVALRTAETWAGQGTAQQRLTAIYAFAGELGVRFPQLGARRLWQIMRRDDGLGRYAAMAFGELFATLIARERDAQHVIVHLHSRLRDIEPVGRTRRQYRLTLIAVLALLRTRNGRTGNPAVVEYLRDHPERLGHVAELWARALQYRPFRSSALTALLNALNAIGRLSGPDAEREARALGDALGDALPPNEHEPLKTDFTILAERSRKRPERSAALTRILLAALDRAVETLTEDRP